jgi:hypothetical protein
VAELFERKTDFGQIIFLYERASLRFHFHETIPQYSRFLQILTPYPGGRSIITALGNTPTTPPKHRCFRSQDKLPWHLKLQPLAEDELHSIHDLELLTITNHHQVIGVLARSRAAILRASPSEQHIFISFTSSVINSFFIGIN